MLLSDFAPDHIEIIAAGFAKKHRLAVQRDVDGGIAHEKLLPETEKPLHIRNHPNRHGVLTAPLRPPASPRPPSLAPDSRPHRHGNTFCPLALPRGGLGLPCCPAQWPAYSLHRRPRCRRPWYHRASRTAPAGRIRPAPPPYPASPGPGTRGQPRTP